MVIRLFFVSVILCCMAGTSFAHGLMPRDGRARLFDRQGNIMVKVELAPNDVQFKQNNNMEISIIDFSKPGFIENKVQLKVIRRYSDNRNGEVFSRVYQGGLISQPLEFNSGGVHELQLQIDSNLSNDNKNFSFEFTLKDNRRFAFVTITVTIAAFLAFLSVVIYFLRLRSKHNSHIHKWRLQ